MHTPFIYSTSRVNTLTQYLLTKTDIERLLVAEPGDDLESALKETYLAPFVARVDSEDIADGIEHTLIDAKKLIHRIAPAGDMFRVLWVQYDIHNLRVFAKATAKGYSLEDCKPYVSKRGSYDPEYLHSHAEAGTLNRLQSDWQVAYDEAVRVVAAGEINKVDGIFDAVYFATSERIVTASSDAFIKKYFKAVIDMFNVKGRLRTIEHKHSDTTPTFITGGTFQAEEMETKDQIFQALSKLDGADFWSDAIEYYEETGNTTRIDARSAEYILTLSRQASFGMFSSASLVLYYLQCKQSAANVRTIVVGKNSGMKEEDIRANLKMAYVNE